jgi:acyl dehydratase
MNPLHADPEVAAQAGYGRPILHGLATLGLAAHALLEEVAGGDPARVGGLACRFSRPVYPGDTLRTEIWREGQGARFRVLAEERGETVITRGDMRLAP